ncbi:MAG TPA: serine/threonine-protein kinase, partial [Roseiflexaceae bacterium]|nr:serine/threonine-protein kinase [Roseiflexaceae bacterium]
MRLEDLAGRRIGRYEIIGLLGRGGMAAVYRARDTVLQREIALKILYPQHSDDTTLSERFQREAVLAARLDHPGIVAIYDIGSFDGMAYMAMRLVTGRPLAELLREQRTLPPQQLVELVEQVAAALDFAHARGIVHRDIKPGNILLEESEPGSSAHPRAVLTDFGIAKALDTPGLTATGMLLGTPDYMAPEQIAGDRRIDGRADIYALGVLSYRALCGKHPFHGGTSDILLAHLEGLPATLPADVALDPPVWQVLRQAMARDPAARYASAAAFALALREALLAPATQIAPHSPPMAG